MTIVNLCELVQQLNMDCKNVYKNLSEKFLKFHQYTIDINWMILFASSTLSDEFIEEFQSDVDWVALSFNSISVNHKLYKKYHKYFKWEYLSKVIPLTDSCMKYASKYVNISTIALRDEVSLKFIEKWGSKDDVRYYKYINS